MSEKNSGKNINILLFAKKRSINSHGLPTNIGKSLGQFFSGTHLVGTDRHLWSKHKLLSETIRNCLEYTQNQFSIKFSELEQNEPQSETTDQKSHKFSQALFAPLISLSAKSTSIFYSSPIQMHLLLHPIQTFHQENVQSEYSSI